MNFHMQYIGLVLGLLLVLQLDISLAQTYKAAVVAYKPDPSGLPSEIKTHNLKVYRNHMKELKDTVDIIVFPENGLTTNAPNSKIKQQLDDYSITPNSNISCPDTIDEYDIFAGLRCSAQLYKLYVVCNVVEKSDEGPKTKYYSTDMVFNTEGKLILKCRKKYPYSKTNFDNGDPDQQCVFDAKFKNNNEVKFALLFDTDMIHESQNAASNVILTSSLQNTLPLSYALSLQLGYSVKNKVNLLASGYADMRKGYGGSGIYLRNGTSIVTTTDTIVITAEITENNNKEVKVNIKSNGISALTDLTYESIPMMADTNLTARYSFNNNDNYCDFKTNLKDTIQPYKWVAFNGGRDYLGRHVPHLVVCALIKPEDQKNENKAINSLSISTMLSTDNIIQIIPISLRSDGLPARFDIEEKVESTLKKTTLSLTEEANLSSFGIVVVLKHDIPSSSSSVHVLHICTICFLPMFLVFLSKKFIFSI